MTTTDARTALGELVLAARTLALRLSAAESAQWERPARPGAEEPLDRSRTGGPADPTAEVALDGTRLALRSAVEEGARALRSAVAVLVEQDRRLARAEERWTGVPAGVDQPCG